MGTSAFEYLVCVSQLGKVIFVNNQWQGGVGGPHSSEPHDRMLDSCPELTSFLNQAGADGWELVSAYSLSLEHGVMEKLILKRSR
jgi:hypothetical protein